MPGRTGSYWSCKKCGNELKTSAEFDLIMHTIALPIGWVSYKYFKCFFEAYQYPMNFFLWCGLIMLCSAIMSMFYISYNYFVFKYAFNTNLNSDLHLKE